MFETLEVLKETGLPYAYDHFAEGEAAEPPFVVYRYPASDNFMADGIVFYSINEVNIELYTDQKDPELEEKIEQALTEHGIAYEKDETWIPEENLFEVIYAFEEAGENKEITHGE